MKKWIFSLVALAALISAPAVSQYGGGGYNPPVNETQIDNALGEGFTASNRVTDVGVGMWAVRIDDGLNSLVDDGQGEGIYKPFLRKRIPTALALNYDLLGTSGYATVAQVQAIIDEYSAAGVPLEIITHFDSEFDQGAASPKELTWAQFQDECDPSELEAAFGVDVVSAAQLGNAGLLAFQQQNHGMIAAALKAAGVKYWDGANSAADSNQWIGWSTGFEMKSIVNMQANRTTQAARSIRPGLVNDPYRMPAARTIDLGSAVMERGGSTKEPWYSAGEYVYSGWTQLVDGSTDPVNNYDATWRKMYSEALAQNWGIVWAIHDSGAHSSELYDNGEFSPHHMAGVMRALADSGFIELGLPRDVYEWGMSQYAEGTDLISNRSMSIPHFAIGDSVGIEMGWIGGMGGNRASNAAWDYRISSTHSTAGINGKFDRSSIFPPDFTGWSETGYRGRLGGATLGGGNSRLWLHRVNLPEGKYELKITATGSNLDIREFNIVIGTKYARPRRAFFNSHPTYGDTILTLYDHDASASTTHTIGNFGHTILLPFSIDHRTILERIDWTADATRAHFDESVFGGLWAGGLFLELSSAVTNVLNFELIYLGPLD